MKLQPRTLLLLSVIWAGLSASGAYATVTGPGGQDGGQDGGNVQVKVPTATPRIVVGKGTIGIVCRAGDGHVQFIHPLEKPDSTPEVIIMNLEAAWHMKYPDDVNGFANADCTMEHISQDDIDALQGQGPNMAPAPAAQ